MGRFVEARSPSADRLHTCLHEAIAAVRAIEPPDEYGLLSDELRAPVAETLELVRKTVASLEDALDCADIRDASFFVLLSLKDYAENLRGAVTNEWLVSVLSSVESSLMQLREIASRYVGRRTIHGPSALARALKCRANVARLLTVAGDDLDTASLPKRARMVGTGIANLLGTSSEGLLSIQGRFLMRGLRRRIHLHLSDIAKGFTVPDAALIETLSDTRSTLQLLQAQANIELREHDRAVVEAARGYLAARDLPSAAFLLQSVRGLDPKLDGALALDPVDPGSVQEAVEQLSITSMSSPAPSGASMSGSLSWFPPAD